MKIGDSTRQSAILAGHRSPLSKSLRSGLGQGDELEAMAIHVGISGWSYGHGQGVLSPHDIPPRDRLGHSLRRYRTVEVNSTYYRWPVDASFASWQRCTP